MVRVRVPGSTSNLGPGFDCLGLALDLHLEVQAELVPRGLHIEIEGESADRLPRDETNLVYAALRRALRRAGLGPTGLELRIRNQIPVGRGLGSSAAAAVAGLLAGALLAGGAPPDLEAVLEAACEIEGHPDNAAPAVLGGLVASAIDAGRVHTVVLPFPATLDALLVIPDVEVPTERARALLPRTVPFADAVFDLQRLALLLGAFVADAPEKLSAAMHDRLHQSHRLALVPGLVEALAALQADPACLAAALSGSGPTLLGFVGGPAPDAGQAAVEVLAREGVRARVQRVGVARRGATWERS